MLEEENQRSLLGSLGEQRIRLWLEDCAEVHQGAQNLDDILLANNAWQEIGKNTFRLKVIQLPVLQPWLALSDDEIEGGMTEGEKNQWKIEREKIGRKKGVVSMVALTNDQADLTCLSGLMAEEWSETIPDKELETGISFQYNGPNTQAPQAILLAVPKPNMPLEYWTVDKLVKTLECTMDLMKIRMVDLDAMGTTRNLFPATFLPFDPHRPGWNDAETILPDLKKWIEQLRR
jgi:hypothetical protein